ncbi:MAG: hypothetical protein PQJ61_00530 [Spirochaetales bacterium]|uniref:Uncharacterized protein n=1 Tax=Candidatus Thalassospirochaeta sargassi TaxID=3119039 RepID=A0AAJ1MM67_9SPIO|nr:hypothetical protein [Spirochaetales bacterium]
MKNTTAKFLSESIKHYTGIGGIDALGGTPVSSAQKGSLSADIAAFFESVAAGQPDISLLPESGALSNFAETALSYDGFTDADVVDSLKKLSSPLDRARAVSELWSPELLIDDDEIFNSWKLRKVAENPLPYKPEEIIIQLNALYSPADRTAPDGIDAETAAAYNEYMSTNPKKIAVYDHPVPVFTRGTDHELEKCLAEMDEDIAYEKQSGVFPSGKKLRVLVSISTTHQGLDEICENWLGSIVKEMKLNNITCYLLSENKTADLQKILGPAASIFTVQGKYACHFGALKYAQLIFERAYGTRAGFKLDTDEGIHSADMKEVSGKTWLQQLCHPYWGGTAINSNGESVSLGFNIGEYVDSRDLESFGYKKAIRTPEVKPKEDVRGPYLIFNKGGCQAKGTMLLNRTKTLEDFISHPLVKGGGYGIDNDGLRKAVPVGFSMVGRAEDQQFYFSAINQGVQGIFNPMNRIIHYKEDVAKSEKQHVAGRNVADIYRMLLFRELMCYLNVVDNTKPFPANYASEHGITQAFFLWLYLIFTESASGNEEEAEHYLAEGLSELLPLLDEIESGKVIRRFESEREAWKDFISAVDAMSVADAESWLESLIIG